MQIGVRETLHIKPGSIRAHTHPGIQPVVLILLEELSLLGSTWRWDAPPSYPACLEKGCSVTPWLCDCVLPVPPLPWQPEIQDWEATALHSAPSKHKYRYIVVDSAFSPWLRLKGRVWRFLVCWCRKWVPGLSGDLYVCGGFTYKYEGGNFILFLII